MIAHSPVISTSWGPARARFVRGLGQDGPITGTICSPYPECLGTQDGSGSGGGGTTPQPTGPFSGQGTGSGPTGAIALPPFPNDLCTKILGQILGQSSFGQNLTQAICNSNFSFCQFLCNLAGQQNNLDTCVQTYCPAVFIAALIASGLLAFWVVDRLFLARR